MHLHFFHLVASWSSALGPLHEPRHTVTDSVTLLYQHSHFIILQTEMLANVPLVLYLITAKSYNLALYGKCIR